MEKTKKDKIKVKCVDFFQKHPDYFKSQISIHFHFTEKQLSKYRDFLDGSLISQNESIEWNKDLIDQFQDKLDWYNFSQNQSAFKDESLINTFVDLIDWKGSEGQEVNSIASNCGIFWNVELIEQYESMINFEKLSSNTNVPWSEKLIDKYINKWDMENLGGNKSVPWTLKLFDKYLGEKYLHQIVVLWNHRLLNNIDYIDKYKDSLEWYFICTNPLLPWKEKNLLGYWKEHIDWWGIAQNEALFEGDKDFFNTNLDKWMADDFRNFKSLSGNKALPWSIPFIETYKRHWDWQALSQNEGIPWSIELIQHFQDYWVWGNWYETNILDENGNEIAPTGGWDYHNGLVTNKAIPWSINFINFYSKNIDIELLGRNEAVWDKAFRPYIDDDVLNIHIKQFYLG